jgi:hypothetical protein
VCTPADIVYSMIVTTSPTGIITDFINFDQSAREVYWFATDNAQSGIYIITITGTISASQTWTKSTSFPLTVTYSCRYSPETI